jgi:multiple sugar transport system permease protein
MCLPLILIIGSLVAYPAFYSIYLSMLNKAQTRFIGLGNFRFLLSRDVFWMVVQQTIIFACSAVLFKALIGLVTAHLINNLPSKGQRKWRGMLWCFGRPAGCHRSAGGGCSIPRTLPSTGSSPGLIRRNSMAERSLWARFSVILVNVWYGAPFF